MFLQVWNSDTCDVTTSSKHGCPLVISLILVPKFVDSAVTFYLLKLCIGFRQTKAERFTLCCMSVTVSLCLDTCRGRNDQREGDPRQPRTHSPCFFQLAWGGMGGACKCGAHFPTQAHCPRMRWGGQTQTQTWGGQRSPQNSVAYKLATYPKHFHCDAHWWWSS